MGAGLPCKQIFGGFDPHTVHYFYRKFIMFTINYIKVNNLLYKPIIIIDNNAIIVPLLIEEYQIEKIKTILKDIVILDTNLSYFKMVIIGAIRFAMKT